MIQVNAHIHMKIIERHSDGIEHCHRGELDDPFPFKNSPFASKRLTRATVILTGSLGKITRVTAAERRTQVRRKSSFPFSASENSTRFYRKNTLRQKKNITDDSCYPLHRPLLSQHHPGESHCKLLFVSSAHRDFLPSAETAGTLYSRHMIHIYQITIVHSLKTSAKFFFRIVKPAEKTSCPHSVTAHMLRRSLLK